jgi:hypothetical protein
MLQIVGGSRVNSRAPVICGIRNLDRQLLQHLVDVMAGIKIMPSGAMSRIAGDRCGDAGSVADDQTVLHVILR